MQQWLKEAVRATGDRSTVLHATFNGSGQHRLGGVEGQALLRKTIYKVYPDSIGVQEWGVTTHSVIWPKMTHYEWWNGVPANDIYLNPIGWNKHRFQMMSYEGMWLSDTPRRRSKGWGGEERFFCAALMRDLVGDRELLMVNTHLDNKVEEARVNGTAQILEWIDTTYPGLPTIVTGDFNCSPVPAPEYVEMNYTRVPYDMFLQAGFAHAWKEAHPHEDFPPTFHDRRGSKYRGDYYGMWHLDWIMTRGFTVKNCDIIRIAKPPQYASDHDLVAAELVYAL